MKIYKISSECTLKTMEYSNFSGMEIKSVSWEITDLEYMLLKEDNLLDDVDWKKYRQKDFCYVTLENGLETYILKADIIETEYLTKDEAIGIAVDFAEFMAKNTDISFNPILKKWDTNIGIGYQTSMELFRIFEANKSKISVSEFSELLHQLLGETKSLDKNLVEDHVKAFIDKYPDLLRYRDMDWFIEHCK